MLRYVLTTARNRVVSKLMCPIIHNNKCMWVYEEQPPSLARPIIRTLPLLGNPTLSGPTSRMLTVRPRADTVEQTHLCCGYISVGVAGASEAFLPPSQSLLPPSPQPEATLLPPPCP